MFTLVTQSVFFEKVFSTVSIASALTVIIFTFLKTVIEFRYNKRENIASIAISENSKNGRGEEEIARPFEITALADYYNQALSRAKIGFWFSILFASIGFGIIIFSFVLHNSSDLAGTIVRMTSGVIIDAVSGLFFVQSTNAQRSMAEFFEKLRLDRLYAEAREMISEIESAERKDQLRSQLILKYSGIDKLLVG